VGLDVPEQQCWIQVGNQKYYWKVIMMMMMMMMMIVLITITMIIDDHGRMVRL